MVALPSDQGRATQGAGASEHIASIAKDYFAKPENTIIVSPDNKSRQQINEAVRGELLTTGTLADDGRQFLTLSHRADVTAPRKHGLVHLLPTEALKYATMPCDPFH